LDHTDHVLLLRGGIPAPPVPRASAGGTVWADFGSGAGAFTLALAELLGPGAVIYAIDRSAGNLGTLARRMADAYPGVSLHPTAGDFTRPLPVPPLDGLVMANALHFIPDREKESVVRHVRSYLKPGGRWLLVEYNVDKGNLWVPHPLSFAAWQALANRAGFTRTRLLATRPSSFLHEFYAAESL